MKNIAWLMSIRLSTRNGFMCIEDAERIEDWYLKHTKQTIEKAWNDQQTEKS